MSTHQRGRCLFCVYFDKLCSVVFNKHRCHFFYLSRQKNYPQPENEDLPKFVCLLCWGKVEKFHLFSEEVKLAQSKYLDELKFADPFPDIADDAMCIDSSNKTEIDKTLSSFPQIKSVESIRAVQPSTASHQHHSIHAAAVAAADLGDSDNSDEQNLENSTEMPTPWFSGLSEAQRLETVRQYFDMSCEICPNLSFKSDTEARIHYLRHHQKMGYIRCCSKRYYDKINVYNHIEFHKHPENFK